MISIQFPIRKGQQGIETITENKMLESFPKDHI